MQRIFSLKYEFKIKNNFGFQILTINEVFYNSLPCLISFTPSIHTQRCFNVQTILVECSQHCMDVERTVCASWEDRILLNSTIEFLEYVRRTNK